MANINVEEILTNADLKTKVQFISAIFHGMDNNSKLRPFMSIGRNTLEAEWLSARGIKNQYELNYREFFIEHFLHGDENEKHISKLFSEQHIFDFCDGLMDGMMYLKETAIENFDAIINDAKNFYEGTNSLICGLYDYVPDEAPAEIPAATEETETRNHAGDAMMQAIEMMDENGGKIEIPAAAKPVQEKQPAPVKKQAPAPAAKERVEVKKSEYDEKEEKLAASMTFELPLAKMIGEGIKDYVENKSGLLDFVDKRILEEAKKLRPNSIQISNVEIGRVDGKVHEMFDKSVRLIVLEKQLFISGAAGTGKTTLAEQIAKSLNLKFAHISCTAGMSEAQLLGRMVHDGSYIQSAFVDCYENGGVFLFDEVDAADANTMLVINSALANGSLSVPNRKDKQTAQRHPDFYCVCAANTWGWGSNEYAGRNILDAAFLDRFCGCKVHVEYDKGLEKELAGNDDLICEAIWNIRKNCIKYKIRRVVSTRAFGAARRQVQNGFTLGNFIDTFTTGWSDEEKKKALEVKQD